ncbi:MAG: glycosyltransferase family 9 protein [Chloroflexota bacterium]|nr:glycosyltransferase family 9 protein [Chloroflexota bacterium]
MSGLRDRLVRLLFPAPCTSAASSASTFPTGATTDTAPFRIPHSAFRILILRPDHLGDLLLAGPALAALRAAFPAAHLTGLVGPWGRPIWQRLPSLDAVETLPFPGIVARPARPWQPYTLLRAQARRLRAGGYDLAISLRFDYWWGALLAEQARIPVRWGYNLPAVAPFLTHAVPYQAGRHEVVQDLALVAALTAPESDTSLAASHPGTPPLAFPLTADERAWAATQLPAGRVVAIHPGTNGSLKLWTLDGWAAVAAWLADQGYPVLFTGSAAEAPLVAAIRARLAPPALAATTDLTGQTSLGQLGALFAACTAVLGVDSGPLHIATAVGPPTVRLYGPSDEAIWGPWGSPARHRVVRAPGTRPGHFLDPTRYALEGGAEMQAISAAQVLGVVATVL